MNFKIELEKCMTDTGIFSIIIGKLPYRKKPYPIILLKVDKSLEVGFYYAILHFGLTVRLLIKDGRKSPLNAKEII